MTTPYVQSAHRHIRSYLILSNLHTQVMTHVYTGKQFLLFQEVMTAVFGCDEYDSIVSGVLDLDKALNTTITLWLCSDKKPSMQPELEAICFQPNTKFTIGKDTQYTRQVHKM